MSGDFNSTASSHKHLNSNVEKIEMKRNITYFNGVGILVGIIIGTGIFISPSKVINDTGSVALALIVWALGGIFALFGALTYVEFGNLIPDFGGEYIYLLEGFAPKINNRRNKLKAIPAFIYSFISILVRRPASQALRCLVSAQYFLRLFFTHCQSWSTYVPPSIAVKLLAANFILLVGVANSFSTKFVGRLQIIFTFCKLFALSVIILGGIKGLLDGGTQELATGFEGSSTNPGDLASAFFSGFYAFNGWQALNYVIKEMEDPARDLRRILVTSLLIVMFFYILVNIAYLTVITKEELIATDVVVAMFGSRLVGRLGEIFMIGAVGLSSLGGGLGDGLTFSRIYYIAAREGHSIESQSYIHKDRKTPIPLLIIYCMLAIVMLLPNNIGSLLKFIGFIDWIFIGLSMVVLIRMKLRMKEHPAPLFAVPLWMPILMVFLSCFLVFSSIFKSPSSEYFYSLGVIGMAIVFYVPFVGFELSLPGMKCLHKFCQKLLLVVPAERELQHQS